MSKFSPALREYLRGCVGKTVTDVRFVEGYGKAQIIFVFTDSTATIMDFDPISVVGTREEQEAPRAESDEGRS